VSPEMSSSYSAFYMLYVIWKKIIYNSF